MSLTLIASDDFNRSNAPVGSDWAYIRNTAWTGTTPAVLSNKLVPNASGANYQVIRWVGAGTFSDDQQSEVELGALSFLSNNYRAGAVARCSPDTNTNADYYAFVMYLDASVNKTTRLIKVVNGTETALVAGTAPWVNGDILSIEVEGTTVRGLRNGTLVSGFTATDSDLSTGLPGILIAGSGGFPTIDNWSGSDIDAPASILSGEAVLSGITADGGFSDSISILSGAAILPGITADGGMGLLPGVITTPVLKNNSGTILSSVSGIVANVYNPTTGVLVVRKTGLTSNGSGIVTISDAQLAPGVTYVYELDLSASSQGRRLPTGVAA